MRTSERLKQANERISRALDHARKARQRYLYNETSSRILKELNAAIHALEEQQIANVEHVAKSR